MAAQVGHSRRRAQMKKLTVMATLALGLATLAMAADISGFVEDSACSTKAGMKNNAECAQKCIKGGDKAVLVTPDGKVYQIANQDKIVAHAGHNVTITGDVTGDSISVTKVTMNKM
jgi:Protein of unknown function (DUF5818)